VRKRGEGGQLRAGHKRLDENLSPKVAEVLRSEDGVDACHVRDRGLLEATDREVLDRAYGEDRVPFCAFAYGPTISSLPLRKSAALAQAYLESHQ